MARIDIPLSVNVQHALDLPPCAKLRIPQGKPLTLTLPTGGSMQAITDLSKGIPSDCATSMNIMVQVAPLLAAIDCPLKILGVIGPLMEVIGALTSGDLLGAGKAMEKLTPAVEKLAPCLGLVIPGGSMVPFVKDLLCLVRASLNCVLTNLRSVQELLNGRQALLSVSTSDAELEVANCTKDNADAQLAAIGQAIDPIAAVLGLMAPLFEIAQLEPIKLEVAGMSSDDLETLNTTVTVLEAAVTAIDDITGGICAG
ncbi:hypothetical protein SAMN05421678_12634 [Actinopolymorpha cephalotaxi]|uniref:Uncharacterized protein n=1 Tax=Actinopolymorpha cephalotaxi TaxID=504797 RepID=A0A1I3BTI5_9ACTN|nr:hypothetical protein [Actinopolymorpha cephalotaxi]NYH83755.1 hypothetical protein [Actinopolymorpha cephalotaxi]SFH65061.1 hypothetical protein SAMN05421678_12634 [Actinopolymorpha cephalotaxi]